MNILQFLKNGSGIHIKKENRGKFTDYCGGKVTSECIAKGKHSSNPAIRKRATFAANARKWKHEKGAKLKKHQAFVKGVSILDSNPDAYKYVKKKVKMAAEGTKANFGNIVFQEGMNAASAIMNNNSVNQQIKNNNKEVEFSKTEAFNKYLQEELDNIQKEQQLFQGINQSPIFNQYIAYQRAMARAEADAQKKKQEVDVKNAKLKTESNSKLANAIMGTVGNLVNYGVNQWFNKYNNSNNIAQNTTTNYVDSPINTPANYNQYSLT